MWPPKSASIGLGITDRGGVRVSQGQPESCRGTGILNGLTGIVRSERLLTLKPPKALASSIGVCHAGLALPDKLVWDLVQLNKLLVFCFPAAELAV